MRGCSLGEESGSSSKCDGSSLKSSEQRNDMTSIILQRLGCYMENEIRIWKLIQKRLQCKQELRYFLLVPTYFSFMGSFFQPWTSVDVLGEGRRPVSLVLFHLPSLDPGSEMSFYITGLIGVPCHLNTMTWKARSVKDTPYPGAAVSATGKNQRQKCPQLMRRPTTQETQVTHPKMEMKLFYPWSTSSLHSYAEWRNVGEKLPYLAARTFPEAKGHQYLSELVGAML